MSAQITVNRPTAPGKPLSRMDIGAFFRFHTSNPGVAYVLTALTRFEHEEGARAYYRKIDARAGVSPWSTCSDKEVEPLRLTVATLEPEARR